MTDINHPSEAEMMSIRNIFDRAANAIVQASELAKQVAELQAKFTQLDSDYTHIIARNDELMQSLQEVRSQRDTAMAERDQYKRDLADSNVRITMLERHQDEDGRIIDQLRSELEAMTKDRDNAVDEWHKADTGKASAEAKLHQIQKALGLPETPAPQPEPALTERKPDAVQVPIQDHGNPDEAQGQRVPDAPKHEWDTPYDPTRF